MTIEKIKELYEARPFQPFIIHLGDGRRVRVASPEFMARTPSGRTVVVNDAKDRTHIIDLLLVTELVVGGNGAQGRGRQRKKP